MAKLLKEGAPYSTGQLKRMSEYSHGFAHIFLLTIQCP